MQTNRKQIGILIIIFSLIALGLIIYFGFIKKDSSAPIIETPVNPSGQLPAESSDPTTTPSDKPRDYSKLDFSNEKPHQTNATDLSKIAMAFSERLGSYSNQSDYGNFTDLKIFMTASMRDWVDTYIKDLKSKAADYNTYSGITTTALSSEVKSFDDKAGTAEILITTSRRESTDKIDGGTAYMQRIRIGMLKVDGEWLVDNAYWEKK